MTELRVTWVYIAERIAIVLVFALPDQLPDHGSPRDVSVELGHGQEVIDLQRKELGPPHVVRRLLRTHGGVAHRLVLAGTLKEERAVVPLIFESVRYNGGEEDAVWLLVGGISSVHELTESPADTEREYGIDGTGDQMI